MVAEHCTCTNLVRENFFVYQKHTPMICCPCFLFRIGTALYKRELSRIGAGPRIIDYSHIDCSQATRADFREENPLISMCIGDSESRKQCHTVVECRNFRPRLHPDLHRLGEIRCKRLPEDPRVAFKKETQIGVQLELISLEFVSEVLCSNFEAAKSLPKC